MSETIIRFDNIQKKFPGVYALKGVSFSIEKGEVHALLGENGAGKSTLLNILHGVFTATDGDVYIEDEKVNFETPVDALKYGIAKVHQEIHMVECLSVGQNIALGFEKQKHGMLDYQDIYNRTDQILGQLGCRFKSRDSISGLSVGELQMIAIAKSLYHNAKIISFDEPTASLSNAETEKLFAIIEELKKKGITILYISHKLDEIFRIADRATILRDGAYIMTTKVGDITKEELIKNMVGRDVSSYAVRMNPSCVQEEIVLDVRKLCGNGFRDISFVLHKGEILGVSGLVGAKRTEVMRAVFGIDKKSSGEVFVHGRPVEIKSPQDALRNGIGLISENRKSEGFVPVMNNAMNMGLAALPSFYKGIGLDKQLIYKSFEIYGNKVQLNIMDPEHLTQNLSGGNQQKVILAKWLATSVDILIFDEPTKGVDVGAKAEIYALMEEFAAEGKSIIMISSELPEVIGMSDRIIVLKEGRMSALVNREEFSETVLLGHAIGE